MLTFPANFLVLAAFAMQVDVGSAKEGVWVHNKPSVGIIIAVPALPT